MFQKSPTPDQVQAEARPQEEGMDAEVGNEPSDQEQGGFPEGGYNEEQIRAMVEPAETTRRARAERYPPEIAEALFAYGFVYEDAYKVNRSTKIIYSYQIHCKSLYTNNPFIIANR